MLKKLFTAAILSAASLLGAAEILFDGAKAGAWESEAEIKDGIVTMDLNYGIKLSKEFIPVVPGKKYTVSGEFFITGNKIFVSPRFFALGQCVFEVFGSINRQNKHR